MLPLSVQAVGEITEIEVRENSIAEFSDQVKNFKMRFPAGKDATSGARGTNLTENGDKNEYMEQLRIKRQERIKEMVELRNRKGDEGQDLELKSRNVRASIRGAQFTLDPKTNEVILTTPSGNEHILKHLPDQALERMKEVGLITMDSTTEKNALEAEVTADGVKYKARIKVKKKLLGLFNREVDAEVILDDETGEVTQQTIPARGFWGRFLNSISI